MPISNPVVVGSAVSTTGGTTIQATITEPIPANAKIFVAVGFFGGGITLNDVSDNDLDPTYVIEEQRNDAAVGVALATADSGAGIADNTVYTATLSATSSSKQIIIAYSTGVASGDNGYADINNHVDTTAWSSGTSSASVATGDIFVAACHNSASSGSPTETPDSPSVEPAGADISTGDGESLCLVYRAGAGATLATTGTWTSANASTAVGVAFPVSTAIPQTVLPDADVTTTGWTTTPLFSKINDESDATVITATAS